MKLEQKFAFRYLFSLKMSLVNVISMISILGVSGMAAALIVILSVFNGFDSLIRSMINQFDPDIKITISLGKTFKISNEKLSEISNLNSVQAITCCIEETVLFEHQGYQQIAILKGVDNNFGFTSGIKDNVYAGDYILKDSISNIPFAVLGCDIASSLGLSISSVVPLKIYVPSRQEKVSITNPYSAFSRADITPRGIFHIHQDFDSKYVIVPIDFAKELLEYNENEFSSLEILCKTQTDVKQTCKDLEQILGKDFEIKDRYHQQDMLYKIMESEKLSIILMLSFIIVIASFNVSGALSMLIIDKKNDIKTISHLGGNEKFIRNIFFSTGELITLSGAVIGTIFGLFICFLQINFHLLTFPEGSFIIDYYPVEIRFTDIIITFLIVTSIGFLASRIPTQRINIS